MTETHSVTCSVPPHILIGYLDVIMDGLKNTIASIEENPALNTVAILLGDDCRDQAPPEFNPFFDQFTIGLDKMLCCRNTLLAVEGIAHLIRTNLANQNGISAEPQFETPAFTADMILHELSLDQGN